MPNVIFHRPVRVGKTIYPKSKRSVEVPESFMKTKLMAFLLKNGDAAVPPPAKAPAPAEKSGK